MVKPHEIYYTYIVLCADGSFYTGLTWNLTQRLKQHNGALHGGAQYTKTRRPVLLQYFEEHKTLKLAMQREFAIKKLSHKVKGDLCKKKLTLPPLAAPDTKSL